MTPWDDLWWLYGFWTYQFPRDQVIEPELVVEDTKFGHQERSRQQANAERHRLARLTSDQLAQIDGYRMRNPNASDKQIAEHFATTFGCAVRTLRGKLAKLNKK
jgi:hypothetical protein